MYLVYHTDNQHSYASRDVIAVCTDRANALRICHEKAKLEGEKIDDDQMHNLVSLNQTQGYCGDGEFDIEEVKTNILL